PAWRYAVPRGEGAMARSGSTRTDSRRWTGRTSRNHPTAPHSVKITPTTVTRALVTRPAHASVIPNAAISGHAVGAGGAIVARRAGCLRPASHHVDEVEDDDPHAVDEMPVPGEHLGALRLLSVDVPAQCEREDEADHGEPDRHVQRVQPDEGIEGGTEEVRGDGEPLGPDEPRPLARGEEEERQAEKEREQPPRLEACAVPFAQRTDGGDDGEGARPQQDRRQDRQVENLARGRAAGALPDVEQVRHDEDGEERALGEDEERHASPPRGGQRPGLGGGGGCRFRRHS